MQDVFRQTVITSLVVGAISTVIIMLLPLEIIPCGENQCAGYLGYKLEYFEIAPGMDINYFILLFYSILFIAIATIAAFFITLVILYMKAGTESKL